MKRRHSLCETEDEKDMNKVWYGTNEEVVSNSSTNQSKIDSYMTRKVLSHELAVQQGQHGIRWQKKSPSKNSLTTVRLNEDSHISQKVNIDNFNWVFVIEGAIYVYCRLLIQCCIFNVLKPLTLFNQSTNICYKSRQIYWTLQAQGILYLC